MTTDFKALLRNLDSALNTRGANQAVIDSYYRAEYSHYYRFEAAKYKVPGLVIHMYEPDPEGVKQLGKIEHFAVVVHNHDRHWPCNTPHFCFELGFDPKALPPKVRKSFLHTNAKYYSIQPDVSPSVSSRDSVAFEVKF